jgi:hypothetical protein
VRVFLDWLRNERDLAGYSSAEPIKAIV